MPVTHEQCESLPDFGVMFPGVIRDHLAELGGHLPMGWQEEIGDASCIKITLPKTA